MPRISRLATVIVLAAAPAAAQPVDDTPVVAVAEPLAAGQPPVVDTAALAATIDDLVEKRVAARLAARKDTAGWNDGFFLSSDDGSSRLIIGGYMQFDGRFFVEDPRDPHVDQFGFRSIRPDLHGTFFEHYDFRLLPDFAGGKVQLQDVFVDVHYSELVRVRFGKSKVPFGLERMQSETSTTFAERGLPSLLTPNRDLGVQVFGELPGATLAYQVGVYNGVADGASGDVDVSNDKELVARVFAKPFARGHSLAKDLGVGAAITYGDKTGNVASPDVPSYRTQGQTQFFGYRAGTTLMDTVIADGRQVRGTVQGHWYAGPFGVLSEYVRSVQKVELAGTHAKVTADAWQVLGQWVVTGDGASYKSVAPHHPFDPNQGHWGAVDLAARIGELRIVDDDVFATGIADPTKSARRAWSAGAGADWFPNRNFRVLLDVERTWYRLGAAGADGPVDRAPETSIVGRVQTVF